MGWVTQNPAAKLSRLKWVDPEVDYFALPEFDALIKAAECMRGRKAARLKAFILVMRWTGLRIGDVATLERRIANGNLLLRTTKAGAHIYAPLRPFVLKALARMSRCLTPLRITTSGRRSGWRRPLSTSGGGPS